MEKYTSNCKELFPEGELFNEFMVGEWHLAAKISSS